MNSFRKCSPISPGTCRWSDSGLLQYRTRGLLKSKIVHNCRDHLGTKTMVDAYKTLKLPSATAPSSILINRWVLSMIHLNVSSLTKILGIIPGGGVESRYPLSTCSGCSLSLSPIRATARVARQFTIIVAVHNSFLWKYLREANMSNERKIMTQLNKRYKFENGCTLTLTRRCKLTFPIML